MVKRRPLPTRAFGAEPETPDVPALAEWIAENRGRSGDLISFQLDQSLIHQISAGITSPCAGGKFYKDRVMSCLIGVDNTTVVDDIAVQGELVNSDAHAIASRKKNIWCALPAPHALGITDDYYHDENEWHDAIASAYRTLMRSMRDGGISGHVLICETAGEVEVSAFTRQKVFFFVQDMGKKSLEALMGYQRQVAVDRSHLPLVFDLINEYELSQLIILDPDKKSITLALSEFDPDQIIAGGYCTGNSEEYWKNLVAAAGYTI
ncbi:MAG: hypothetical protein OS112_08400 [Methanoregula sp.]|nr:MAG: hypothetical protein OS112_08400 [Methanoregula sp.]